MTDRPTRYGTASFEGDAPAPGDAAPRWPGAPAPREDANGTVENAVGECGTCGEPTTLCYRCSECGADLAGKTTTTGGGTRQ